MQCFTFDLQYVQTGFKSYECRAENDEGHHWERREAMNLCVWANTASMKESILQTMGRLDIWKRLDCVQPNIPHLLCPTRQFHSVHSALWLWHQNKQTKKRNPHIVATDLLLSYPHASCLKKDSWDDRKDHFKRKDINFKSLGSSI